MKYFFISVSNGALALVLSLCFFTAAHAQNATTATPGHNAEALWNSYNHQAFQRDLQQSLNIGNTEFDAFQKYLIQQKKTGRDMEEFFMNAKIGIINPININAYFTRLKNKYYSYYPDFKIYSDNQALLASQHLHTINPALLACGSPCTNPDFATNDFTAWVQQDGTSVNGTPPGGVNLFPGTTQTSITSPGPDPVVGAALPMVFPGAAHSAMVGNGPVTGAQAGALSTSFTVSAATTNFTYSYAVVLENPTHPANQQPYFMLTLTDQAGNILACGEYDVTAGVNSANFILAPGTVDVYYRNWTTVFVDLTAYVGQCVTLNFICRDCTQGGHYGYAYVYASCAPAQIVTSSPAICGSSTITLTAPAGASAYSWTGPGIVGSATGQIISANVAGTYTVVLTSALGGCTTTLHITIAGNPTSPTALFSSNTVCAGTPTQFTDQSLPAGGITAWAWDFLNNGTTDATTANPTYTFPAAGTYPVHLTITWPPCTHDTIINVTVIAPPVPTFTSQPVCMGSASVFITNTVAAGYSWDFGDGTNANSQDPTHTYPASGTYTATLTVTIPGGCTGSVSQNVLVNQAPAASFTVPPVCLNVPSTFSNTTVNGTSFTWAFGDGTNSTNPSPTHIYGGATTFTATLIAVGLGGCTNTSTQLVVINPLPVAAFTGTDVCLNAPTTFTDASTIANPGTINQWAWNFGDGSAGTGQTPTHTYTTPGTFTVELLTTSADLCADSTKHVVTVYALPVPAFTGDSLVHCMPWCVNFTDASTVAGGNITNWTWNFGDGSPNVTQNAYGVLNHCYNTAGSFGVTLTVTSSHNCKATLNKPNYITTWPLPEAAFTASPQPTSVLAPLVTLNDQSTNAVAWHWNFGDGDSLGMNNANPVHLFPSDAPGTFNVQEIVYSIHGCTDTAVAPVVIGPIFTFYIANCFTPNGDGNNDKFYGFGVGIAKYQLIIFDRWGNHIFTTQDLYEGWDGTVQGTSGLMCQEDVYVWKVDLTDVFNIKHAYVGHVSLIK